MHEAKTLWEYGVVQDEYLRTRSARAISYFGVFSMEQLARIARIKVSDLQKVNPVEYTGVAGKLNPETLDTLRLFYLNYRTNGVVSIPLLSIMLREGTDLLAVHQITGIPMEELE